MVLGASAVARADEPPRPSEPRLLSEPGEITDVVDAFDVGDLFDLHLTLGYQYSWKTSHIRRETSIGDAQNPSLTTGGFVASNMNVASYQENTSRLNTRVDIGVYHDIGLYLRMPVILSNDRQLKDLDGSAGQQGVVLAGAPADNGPLFALPFRAPQRSGIEYLAIGLDFGLMNQFRDPSKPTWMAGFEVRLSVSEPLHPCNANASSPLKTCAYVSDVNRNGTSGDSPGVDEGNFPSGERQGGPGVSRGTTGLELHSFISKRIKYVEPYAGFRTLFEFPSSKSEFGNIDVLGSIVNHPPVQGWVFAGLQVIPWEHREQFQRVTLDGRFGASYRSEGRDYSELFDALGSSGAASLRRPNFALFRADPNNPTASVVNPASQRVYFAGLTDVSPYFTIQASIQVTWQAGEYIKFTAGGSYAREQSHVITNDQQCDPAFVSDITQSGPCRVETSGGVSQTGIPNPNYRPAIDSVGRRFRTDDTNLWDAWLMGIVMF
jgi:hypothetical protein